MGYPFSYSSYTTYFCSSCYFPTTVFFLSPFRRLPTPTPTPTPNPRPTFNPTRPRLLLPPRRRAPQARARRRAPDALEVVLGQAGAPTVHVAAGGGNIAARESRGRVPAHADPAGIAVLGGRVSAGVFGWWWWWWW